MNMNHKLYDVGAGREDSNFEGLMACSVCRGAEGTLPSECPGVKMTDDQQRQVMACEIDFKEGAWITPTFDRFARRAA